MVQPYMQTNTLTCIECRRSAHHRQIASNCHVRDKAPAPSPRQCKSPPNNLYVETRPGPTANLRCKYGDTGRCSGTVNWSRPKASHRAWQKLFHHILPTPSGILKALSTNSVWRWCSLQHVSAHLGVELNILNIARVLSPVARLLLQENKVLIIGHHRRQTLLWHLWLGALNNASQ